MPLFLLTEKKLGLNQNDICWGHKFPNEEGKKIQRKKTYGKIIEI